MSSKAKVLLAFWLILAGFCAKSQITFSRYIIDSVAGSPGFYDDQDFAIHYTSDKGYIIGGTTMAPSVEPWLIKIDSNGNIKWSKQYNGALMCTDVLQAGPTSYIAGAFTSLLGAYNIFKVTNNGSTVVWNKKLTVPGNIPSDNTMIMTTDSGIVFPVYLATGSSSSAIVTKIDKNGNLIWTHKFDSLAYQASHEFPLIKQTADKGFILTGGHRVAPFSSTSILPVLVKMDSIGNLQWQTQYVDTGFVPTSVAQAPDKGYIVVAQNYYSSWAIHVFKTDSLGTLQWYKNIVLPPVHYPGDSRAICIPIFNGGYLLASVPSTHSYLPENGYTLLTFLNANGDTLSNVSVGDSSSDNELGNIEETPDNGFIIASMHTRNNWSSLKTYSYGVAYVKTDVNGLSCKNGQPVKLNLVNLPVSQQSLRITDSLKVYPFVISAITPQALNSYEDTICYARSTLNAGCSSVPAKCFGKCDGKASANATGGRPPYSYNWSPGGGTNATDTGLCAGIYTVTVTDSSGNRVIKQVTITQPAALTDTVTTQSTACTSNTGSATSTVSGGTPAYTYTWSPSGGSNFTATGLSAGTYTCTTVDAGGCSITASATVKQVSGPGVNVTSNPSCIGGNTGNATASAVGGKRPYTYSWSPAGGTNSLASGLSAGSYSVTVTDSNGCSQTASVTVASAAIPVTACCNTTITSGQFTNLNVTPENKYVWSPNTGLSCDTCQSPIASPTVTTMYYVVVTDSNGCIARDSVLITVNEKCGDIFVPTAFSPNNDGENDVLYIKGNCIQSLSFSIFDRWGNKVFQTNDQSIGWDGKYNGQPLNAGTYVFYLTALDRNNKVTTSKGNVTLVR